MTILGRNCKLTLIKDNGEEYEITKDLAVKSVIVSAEANDVVQGTIEFYADDFNIDMKIRIFVVTIQEMQ